eukprot:Tbor_TRINITY_DN532_c0_g1::TRINITY_DN532_c0_g1_i1::g.23326::m.23326/K02088/CDK3; cyclin-dependent kinase 3
MATSARVVDLSFLDSVDISAIGNDYEIERKLGEGAYGVVFSARTRSTGAYVAIKKLRLDGLSEGIPATAIREITLLQNLDHHPNIVHLLQVISKKGRLYLIFELMNLDLGAFIRNFVNENKAFLMRYPGTMNIPIALPIPLVKHFTRQILHALWCCHGNRIVHRDLKPGNILVCETNRGENGVSSKLDQFRQEERYMIKIADFGLARKFELPLCTHTNEVVTLWYRAPELLLGDQHYTPAVDIWSVGLIVVEMITGAPLLRGNSDIDQLKKIFCLVGVPTEVTWPGVTAFYNIVFGDINGMSSHMCGIPPPSPEGWASRLLRGLVDRDGLDFITQLLIADPRQRVTVADALKHKWLS